MKTLSDARILIDDIRARLNYTPYISSQWNDRLRTTMGRAWSTKNLVEFSSFVWQRATEEQRIQVVYHEAAHVIANNIHNARCGHDWRWKNIMRRLGRVPDRCHSVAVPTRKNGPRATTIEVVCACGIVHPIGTVRQRKMRMGYRYSCLKCHNFIRLES